MQRYCESVFPTTEKYYDRIEGNYNPGPIPFIQRDWAMFAIRQITPLTRSSKAERAALAPSPMAMMICLKGTLVTSPAA